MEFPWLLLLVTILSPFVSNYKFQISDELVKNCTNQSDNVFEIKFWENNRVANASSVLLFNISEVSSAPIWQITPNPFLYKQVANGNNSYSFYTNQFMDYETEITHRYILLSTLDSNLIFINIHTVNYDDEEPTLTAPMCTMDENTPYTAQNTTCNATLSDPDGWLNQTTFTILNSKGTASNDLELEDRLFEIYFDKNISDTVFKTTVFIVTKRTLDYETKTFYSFPIQARDGANHSTIPSMNVTCIIDVDDLNDMPPQWTDYFSTKQIEEESDYIFNVTAVDGDRKINAAIEYTLKSYDPDICAGGSCISIATVNGVGIINVKPIDRDAKDLTNYKFEIMAQEQDDPPFYISLNVTFYVEDIDDNNPLFINVTGSNYTVDLMNIDVKVVEYTIWENFAGTLDGSIFIQDIDTGDNAQFNVVLQEDPEKDYADLYTEAFMVVPTAGYRHGDFQISVKNYSYLDYENPPWQNISFYVHSSGTKNSFNADDLLVKVHLRDYNDELPKFANSTYTAEVDETIKQGEVIIEVKATDRDKEDAVLRHQLTGAPSIIGLMSINSSEGVISVAVDNAFDYDKINPVIFQVQAIDAVDHTTTVSVTVNLLDVNNKAPTYTVMDVIRVDENQKVGTILNATITASDVDTTRNLTAEINWDASYAWKNSIRLDTTSENLRRAIRFLDITYDIVPKSTDGTIEIKLVVNDNNKEGTAPDYETFDTLYLHVNITDLNTELPEFQDQMSIDAVIVVNINDINDNQPIFTDETLQKNRTIYELSRIGSIVGSIEATDADVGDTVSYLCTYINEHQDWFECDKNGQITVKSQKIDADTDYVYYVGIKCNATDGYWNTTEIFKIYVLDTNDKTPQVKVNGTIPSKIIVEVEEKSPADTFVTRIDYDDADRDIPFHTAECRRNGTDTTCFDSFKIEDNVVKVLRGGNDIDRDEKFPDYTCTITCYDNPRSEQGFGSRDNTTTFVIKLKDINDHAPELKTYHLTGTENLKKGDSIGAVVAEDKDEGLNAEIDMEIVSVTKHMDGGDEDITERSIFEVVRIEKEYLINATFKQWNLNANNDLRDQYGNYTLQLKLSDQGDPPNSTDQAFLEVTLNKYNYYPPVFMFPNSSKTSFLLTSDQDVGEQLVTYYNNETFGDIMISDGNGMNTCLDKWTPTFNLDLLDVSDKLTEFFVLINNKENNCGAQLQVTNAYDKKEAVDNTYQLRLSVTLDDVPTDDANEAKYSEHIDIFINFIDVDENPVFNQSLGPLNVSFLEDDDKQYEELSDERKAYYPKLLDSDEIKKYYFLNANEQNISETFSIDKDSGTISLKEKLDYLEQNHYEFEIRASKNDSMSLSKDNSSMQVIINVIDINNHYPQWTQSEFFGALLKSTQKGSTIVNVKATDLDTIDEGKLRYTLNSTINGTGSENIASIDEAFILDDKSGTVKLNFQVDYNMNGYFVFLVKVEDAEDDYGNGPHENITTVVIHIVTEENTVTFKFENNLDTTVDRKSQILRIISNRLGWDCHDQSIDKNSENGVTFDNVTAASIYCIQNYTLLKADDIKSKLNNIYTFQQLKNELLEQGILLQNFNSASTTVDNLESTLKAALIGVTVFLGAMCIILAVTFFLKTRELSRRLSKLTEKKFGSDESNINRKGINAPTTNVFAVEGSNPVFNIEASKTDDLFKNTDNISIGSGNSDLFGVEDNPEFDEMFGKDGF